MRMKKFIVALGFLALSMPLLANDVEFNWTFTPEREDGTPATIAEVGGYKIYMVPSSLKVGDVVDATATVIKTGIASTATTYIYPDFEGLGTGIKYFVVTVTDIDGVESTASIVQKVNLSRLKAPGQGRPVIILRN
jgi:hypothetical protein